MAELLSPILNSGSDGYESTGSSDSEVEVFMVQPVTPVNDGAEGNAAGPAVASRLILSTPIAGQSDTEKSLEASRKALATEQDRLARDRADMEAREKEWERSRSHNRRRQPSHSAAAEVGTLAARAREARASILGGEVNGTRVYRTPAKNLIATAALADAIELDPAHPAAGNLSCAVTLIKTMVDL